jgi:hypothetical protein
VLYSAELRAHTGLEPPERWHVWAVRFSFLFHIGSLFR